MEKMLETAQTWITVYGLKVIAAIAILVIGAFAAKLLQKLVRRLLRRGKVDEMLVSFASSVVYVAIMAFVIIAALGQLGVQTASFIAVVGAAGLAIGLALQGSLANFAAGVLMVIFKPFKVGDYIEAAGTAGVVEAIGIFTSTLKTPDNKMIIIPNAKLTADNITNYSAMKQRRVDLVASISYGDDIDKVRNILNGILDADARVMSEPAPTVAVLSLSSSSVDFAVRPWVKTEDYWGVFFDLQEQIKKQFDANGVTIPFPQQEVHLHNVN
ncbi:MAG TPA: mechanosensitive ion channel [Smithellaceae bacterium]|nr:mechanosensitive ion channel [Smithellaceae bacterium]